MYRFLHFLLILAAVAMATMMTATVADVIFRNALNSPIRGTFEVVQICMVLLIFLGMPIVFWADQNISVDVIDTFIGDALRRAVRTLAAAASVAFLAVLLWAMIEPAGDAFSYVERFQETQIATSTLWIPILLGTALALLSAVYLFWRRVFAPPDEQTR